RAWSAAASLRRLHQNGADAPALLLRERACLLDQHAVGHVALVALVVRLELLGHADDPLVARMAEDPLDPHHPRLLHGVAHHDALTTLALAHGLPFRCLLLRRGLRSLGGFRHLRGLRRRGRDRRLRRPLRRRGRGHGRRPGRPCRATPSATPHLSQRMPPGLTTATHSSGLPLPLPIRVSAGFFVTGLSGNTRIQTLPPRLRLRVRATRAASIWRLVTQPGSSALSPYSPKDSVEPRCALPRMFPRCALRYLTRLGISMAC